MIEISKMPTVIHVNCEGKTQERLHESILRSWNILNKVKAMLAEGTPSTVILECIEVMEMVKHPDNIVFEVTVTTLQERINALNEKREALTSDNPSSGA